MTDQLAFDYRNSDPDTSRLAAVSRLMQRVVINESTACWEWTGTTTKGYGRLTRGAKTEGLVLAHRFAYELLVGAIPEGLQLDHLCRNRRCVNPGHLEPVTPAENVRRANDTPLCRRGHPRTAENTYTPPAGGRYCKTCRQINHGTTK